jgi:hypothetical protein
VSRAKVERVKRIGFGLPALLISDRGRQEF